MRPRPCVHAWARGAGRGLRELKAAPWCAPPTPNHPRTAHRCRLSSVVCRLSSVVCRLSRPGYGRPDNKGHRRLLHKDVGPAGWRGVRAVQEARHSAQRAAAREHSGPLRARARAARLFADLARSAERECEARRSAEAPGRCPLLKVSLHAHRLLASPRRRQRTRSSTSSKTSTTWTTRVTYTQTRHCEKCWAG